MTEQLSLFEGSVVDAPITEGIKYAGSKRKLLPHILGLAKKTGAKSVLDGFSGTTRVSQAMARQGYQIVSNDTAVWSEVFGTCYLLNCRTRTTYSGLIEHLNGVAPRDGWFTENYGGRSSDDGARQNDGLKKPWQIHNTRKLDAIREEIDRLALSPVEKAVALTSLILALDRVDSTLGHYVSYLRDWSPRSFGQLHLEVPRVFVNAQPHRVTRKDVFALADLDVDLAYYDPPYGSNNEKMPPSRVRYASYYHVWTTIILNDRPELFGKAARRKDTADTVASSVFEEFRRNAVTGRFLALDAIDRLIRETRAQWIVLSYSSGGRATAEELNEVLQKNGTLVDVVEMDYKCNVMAHMKWTNAWVRDASIPNREFLFLLEKSHGKNPRVKPAPSVAGA
ncbi:MAG: DNA adenine methylase [Pirellulales bacterium]|nr:DNA adenine methylase [Pirellulales bacterium]